MVGAAATAALVYAPARNRTAVQAAALAGLTVVLVHPDVGQRPALA